MYFLKSLKDETPVVFSTLGANLSFVLTSAPRGVVHVTLSWRKQDFDEAYSGGALRAAARLSFSHAAVRFGPQNWSKPVSVAVRVADTRALEGRVRATLLCALKSADGLYNALQPAARMLNTTGVSSLNDFNKYK